jgi:hypothetical protein
MKQDSEKVIKKAFSLYPRQLKAIGEVVDLDRHGPFSQFIQQAIDEKLDRIYSERNPQTELKAS